MFNKAERFQNYALGDNRPSVAPGDRFLRYKICPLFICGICYWVAYAFFSDGIFLRVIQRGIYRIPIRNSFYFSYFFFTLSALFCKLRGSGGNVWCYLIFPKTFMWKRGFLTGSERQLELKDCFQVKIC